MTFRHAFSVAVQQPVLIFADLPRLWFVFLLSLDIDVV